MYIPTVVESSQFILGMADGCLICAAAGVPPFKGAYPSKLVLAWFLIALLCVGGPALACIDSLATTGMVPSMAALHLILGALAVAMRTLDTYLDKRRAAAEEARDGKQP